MGLRDRVRGAVDWLRGVRAVLKAMSEMDRPPGNLRRSFREPMASPPLRLRPIPAPPRVGRKTVAVAPAAGKVSRPRAKPKAKPLPPQVRVKRGQKHR